VRFKLYVRTLSNTEATSAWDAGTLLTAVACTDATWNVDSETIAIATLSLVAGDEIQIELTRIPTDDGDTLVGNVLLEKLTIGVS
jgi:hypothetical protein